MRDEAFASRAFEELKEKHTCKEAQYKEETSPGYQEEQAVQEWKATGKDEPKVRPRMTKCKRGLQLRRKA